MDAKYVKVYGYESKIPFLYVIDYHSHDIVCGFLCHSENRDAFALMFRMLKEMNYPLRYLIVDDVIERLKYPLKWYFPGAKVQLCPTHFLRNARSFFKEASKESRKNYDPFLLDLRQFLRLRTTVQNKEKSITWLLQNYGVDPYVENLMKFVIKKKDYLFLFCKGNEDIPHTNNLIEVFNSHLEGRLKTIKGFRSFHSAERFLNGWMVRRRTKEFSDCVKKFSYLNGQTSLGYALQDERILKRILKDIYG